MCSASRGPRLCKTPSRKAGLRPDVALTARDADVIKTYVRIGLGVGIIADLALDPRARRRSGVHRRSHLFPVHTTWVGFARDGLLRRYMYDFLSLLAPHLNRKVVDRAAASATQTEIDALFAKIPLPTR